MDTKVSYTLVGLFVIVLGAALIGVVLWLTVGVEAKVYETYKVYIRESVSGLNPQAAVKYRGVEVGRVAAIELDPDNPERVELTLNIEPQAPVRQNTRAVLVTQGLTGLAYVELTGGSRNAAPLKPTAEQPIPVIQSGPSLVTRLEDAFTTLLTKFNTLSQRLELLLNEENQGNVSAILGDMETLTHTLAEHADSLGEGMDSAAQTLTQVAQVSAELPPLLARVGAAVTAVENMSLAITKTTAGLGAAVQASRRDLQKLTRDTAPEVGALLGELRQLTDVIQRFGRELERNPRMLLFGREPSQPGPGE